MAMPHGTKFGVHTVAALKGRCRVDAETGCWNWSMSADVSARVWSWNPQRQQSEVMRGTRAAWLLSGKAIPPKHVVYLTCTSAICCNPAHMLCGPKTEAGAFLAASGRLKGNMMARANRARVGREMRGKLTTEHRALIDASAETNVALGVRCGVAHTTISAYRHGKTWRVELPQASVFAWARAA